MELRERLAELRRSQGVTLRDLRERIEEATGERMAISYLSALERVERSPSIETLGRIAAGYGMTVQELLEPVGKEATAGIGTYPKGLEAAAKKRNLTSSDIEGVENLQYRGRRPETEQEWDVILGVLSLLGEREEKE